MTYAVFGKHIRPNAKETYLCNMEANSLDDAMERAISYYGYENVSSVHMLPLISGVILENERYVAG